MNAYRKQSSREDRESDVVYKRRKGKEEEVDDDSDVEICVPLSKPATDQKGMQVNKSKRESTESRQSPMDSSLENKGESDSSSVVSSTSVQQMIKERLSKASGYVPDLS